MGLYTFLYENLLYRLYIIHIQPARIVTARLSRYTAHTAYTAIQPYTPYIIQRYTASLRQHPLRPRRGGTSIKGSWPGGPGGGAPRGENSGFFYFYAHFSRAAASRHAPRKRRFMCQRCGAS